MSSAYHPISNSRAELAVKATKRFLMKKVGPNDELNNDRMNSTREICLIRDANYPLHRSF